MHNSVRYILKTAAASVIINSCSTCSTQENNLQLKCFWKENGRIYTYNANAEEKLDITVRLET